MPRNLRDDFRMYYSGTNILLNTEERGKVVMYVEEVSYRNHGYTAAEIIFHGHCYGLSDRGVLTALGNLTVQADKLQHFNPEAGYYKFGTNPPVYLEFQVQNRSNRRGFEANRALLSTGQAYRLSSVDIANMFLKPDFKGKVFTDLCVHQSNVLWRGSQVGSFHDGQLQLEQDFEFLREHAEKQLQRWTRGN